MENIFNLFQERFISLLARFDISYKRYFHKKINFDDKLIGIIGARGVGKTTFLLQLLKENQLHITKKLYVSADSIEFSDVSLFEFAKYFESIGGEILVIDEIHKYKDFEKHLKQIYDFLNLKVLFSGSSAIKLEHSKTDLSRRATLYKVNGLSYREFLELKLGISLKAYSLYEILENHLEITYEILKILKPLEHWKEYLQKGFYPFYFENPETYYIKLEQIINTVIETDLPFVFKIDVENLIKLKKLVKLICVSEPYELNLSKLAKKIEINRITLYKYIDYLYRGDILFILKPTQKGDSIFTKPEKIYMNNTNLNYCYCENPKIGTIRETFIMSMLRENHKIEYPKKGDVKVDEKYTFEIGGKNKNQIQIKNVENSYLIIDDIEVGTKNKIPLWLLGFLY